MYIFMFAYYVVSLVVVTVVVAAAKIVVVVAVVAAAVAASSRYCSVLFCSLRGTIRQIGCKKSNPFDFIHSL